MTMMQWGQRRWPSLLTAFCTYPCASMVSGGVRAFADVGQASAAESSCNSVTASTYDVDAASGDDAVSVTSDAVTITYTDCRTVVVEVSEDSDGNAQLDLSSRRIEGVDSLPSVSTLDLSNNSIESLTNVSIPGAVQKLDLSDNPFTSLRPLDFPSDLQNLVAASGSLTGLHNFSFPDSTETLNFSSNPIARVAGVRFPSSLEVLTLITTSRLEEIEVRETDATLFANLDTFTVSVVSDPLCSSVEARNRYVQDTLLCVLSDDVFENKYASSQASASGSGGTGSASREMLDATMDQSRSWFLIFAGVLLVIVAAGAICIVAFRSFRERLEKRQSKRYAEVPKPNSLTPGPRFPDKDTWRELELAAELESSASSKTSRSARSQRSVKSTGGMRAPHKTKSSGVMQSARSMN